MGVYDMVKVFDTGKFVVLLLSRIMLEPKKFMILAGLLLVTFIIQTFLIGWLLSIFLTIIYYSIGVWYLRKYVINDIEVLCWEEEVVEELK